MMVMMLDYYCCHHISSYYYYICFAWSAFVGAFNWLFIYWWSIGYLCVCVIFYNRFKLILMAGSKYSAISRVMILNILWIIAIGDKFCTFITYIKFEWFNKLNNYFILHRLRTVFYLEKCMEFMELNPVVFCNRSLFGSFPANLRIT